MMFNEDGDFGEPGEAVTLRDNNGSTSGVANFSNQTKQVFFDVPVGSFGDASNPIATRVRLSSAGGLGPTGLAADGEVEDYIYNLGPTAISLSNFKVTANAQGSLAAGIGLLLVLCMTAIFIFRRKENDA